MSDEQTSPLVSDAPHRERPPILPRLMEVIESRRRERPSGSYVVELLDGGAERIGGKVTEEAAELAEAARHLQRRQTGPLVHEAADLLFHMLVLLGWADVPFSAVEDELEKRFGIGGLQERDARQNRER